MKNKKFNLKKISKTNKKIIFFTKKFSIYFIFFLIFFSVISTQILNASTIKEEDNNIKNNDINFIEKMFVEKLKKETLETPKNLIETKNNKLTKNTKNKKNENKILTPKNRIKEEQIKVYDDKIIIYLKNAEWSKFEKTNSMLPFLDENSNAIQIKPRSETELKEGDIISYEYNITENNTKKTITIIHRIIKIGEDKEGWYAITKGDNNKKEDPKKVRFSQIKRVLVAIIY